MVDDIELQRGMIQGLRQELESLGEGLSSTAPEAVVPAAATLDQTIRKERR
jgi:hypothetical protein